MAQFIDKHIGNRIRMRRLILGVSELSLGETVGCEVIQIQQFERGQKRVDASTLFDMARALNVPVTYFFDKLIIPEPVAQNADDYVFGKGASEIIASYHGVCPTKRKTIFECAAEQGKPAPNKLNSRLVDNWLGL